MTTAADLRGTSTTVHSTRPQPTYDTAHVGSGGSRCHFAVFDGHILNRAAVHHAEQASVGIVACNGQTEDDLIIAVKRAPKRMIRILADGSPVLDTA